MGVALKVYADERERAWAGLKRRTCLEKRLEDLIKKKSKCKQKFHTRFDGDV